MMHRETGGIEYTFLHSYTATNTGYKYGNMQPKSSPNPDNQSDLAQRIEGRLSSRSLKNEYPNPCDASKNLGH